MGYRIESYTLDELQRVALPGTAATALFWAIPLGNWPPRALDNLWHKFTRGNGVCRRLGLLLAKDTHQVRDGALRKSNLSGLVASGKLAELLPKGAARQAASVPGESACGLLICSGAYPQPGWGVWINIEPDIDIDFETIVFENTLRHIVLLDPEGRQVEPIRIAADDWATLENIKQKKPLKPISPRRLEIITNLLGRLDAIEGTDDIKTIIGFLDSIRNQFDDLAQCNVPLNAQDIRLVSNASGAPNIPIE